jgi:hypothetical protein
MTSNEVTTPAAKPLDNFSTYDDAVQTVDGDNSRSGLLAGTRLKFTNEVRWMTVDDDDFTGKHLLVVNVRRTEVRWGREQGPPLETIELGPNDKYRDLDQVNSSIPKSEWREGPNGPQGPWQRQGVLEFIDIKSMASYSWPTSTIGGGICIRELTDRVNRMRHFRGVWVYPLVKLDHKFMRTKYQGRERPHLEIVEWYHIGPSGVELAAVPAQLALTKVPTEPALEKVQEPSTEEELNDRIPY